MNDYFPISCAETLDAIGLLIKNARQKTKIRQKDLALQLGVSAKTISNMEAGSRTVEVGTVLQALWQLGLLHQIMSTDLGAHALAREATQRVRLRTVSKKHPF